MIRGWRRRLLLLRGPEWLIVAGSFWLRRHWCEWLILTGSGGRRRRGRWRSHRHKRHVLVGGCSSVGRTDLCTCRRHKLAVLLLLWCRGSRSPWSVGGGGHEFSIVSRAGFGARGQWRRWTGWRSIQLWHRQVWHCAVPRRSVGLGRRRHRVIAWCGRCRTLWLGSRSTVPHVVVRCKIKRSSVHLLARAAPVRVHRIQVLRQLDRRHVRHITDITPTGHSARRTGTKSRRLGGVRSRQI